MIETFQFLLTWTPYLLRGFLTNIGIAAFAMCLGTSAAYLAERTARGSPWPVRRACACTITILRNTPSLVLLFYLAVLTPNVVTLWSSGWSLPIPPWLKSGIALSASPMVLMYWNFEAWQDQALQNPKYSACRLELPGKMLESFTITTLASSVSSLVGVSELISRCNVIINASSNKYSFVVYFYACLYFCAFLYGIQRMVMVSSGRRASFFTHREDS